MNIIWSDFRLSVLAFAKVSRKGFNGKFSAKNDRTFYVTIRKSKFSPYIIHKYLDHMLVKFEQNRMVRNVQNFDLFGKKWLTTFEKVLTPFWKMFL